MSFPRTRTFFDPDVIAWAFIAAGIFEGVRLGILRRHGVLSAMIRVPLEVFFWMFIAFQFVIICFAHLQDIVGDMRKTGDLWAEVK